MEWKSKRSGNARTWLMRTRWIILWIVGGICVLCTSCIHDVKKEEPHPPSPCPPVKRESYPEFRFHRALELLDQGETEPSQDILVALLDEPDPPEIRPKAYFYLGIIKLYDVEDLSDMEECKRYFDAYPQEFPKGPFQDNAKSISQVLQKLIGQARRQQEKVKELTRQLEEEARDIETLQYKIMKLEEIQQETDKKRNSLELTH